MAEDFPTYRHEDSDDDTPAERSHEHTPPPVTPEQHVPKEQEGTIFSRNDIAPSLSRPLFDFIRKQEQPEARLETPDLPAPGHLPSVSVPGEPEVRTYQPPVDFEVAQAIHEAAAEDDDDDEDADDHAASHAARPARTPPPPPAAPHYQELQRPLNEQFEEIIRTEMGEEFTALTSDEQLGELEPEATEDEPAAPEPITTARPEPRPAASEWAAPAIPEAAMHLAADDDAVPAPAAAGPSYVPPTKPSEAGAFYYNEDEPDDVHAPGPVPLARAAAGGGGGGVPPTTSRHSGPSGAGAFGAPPAGFNSMPMPSAANAGAYAPNLARMPERRENHNGRWFVAGFVTGWVIKQHLANKKLARFQEGARKEVAGLNEKNDHMAMEQQTLKRQVRRNEGQLQEVQAAQSAQAVRANEQALRSEQPAAAPNQQPTPPAAAPNQAPAPAAEQLARVPAMEAPLQHPGSGEVAFAGGRPEVGETPFSRPVTAEFVATRTPTPPEQAPNPHAEAQEMVARAYELQAGEHIEHAAGGGHNVIVDRHGHEVQDAIEYGDEFQFQKRQEQVRAGAFTSNNNGSPVSTDNNQAYSIITGLNSGQVDPSHGLPLGTPSPAARQRLLPSKKDNPLVATASSPWLWAAVIVLLAAFFVAAFI
jgi:hypothetical protein